ncbi:hypothetical protein Skr01_34490 [Sphaerisporangium krabiense]|uniref:Uncharacterized protein n=1 Tax=Sphaerisporangium krabiense TaxID=763782 RepID=A0A7W8Z3F5_9ACTN|nr:hypothetical protein [Sphaerisporangium krabiense]MBB5626443.1 hypothetical protein [Sphaerisporangium krabiense]GII63364.1 hypothetical protein Skr01_34490 [Sphaerisporangium krabiense]
MRGIKVALLAGTAAASLLALTPPAHAAPPTPSPAPAGNAESFASTDDADLQRKIDKHIAAHGGRQQGKNQIVWESTGDRSTGGGKGGKVVMTFPLPTNHGVVSTYARITCDYGWYCAYEHAFWDREGGAMLGLYNYGTYNLEPIGWAYRVSAFENNQSDSALGSLNGYNSYPSRAWAQAAYVGSYYNDQALSITLAP